MPPGASIADILARLAALESDVVKQAKRIAQLEAENAQLKIENASLRHRLGQNSSNSSRPPSSDGPQVPKPNRSLRSRSGKSAGAQAGHPPASLKFVDTPEAIIEHRPRACAACGEGLAARPDEGDPRANRHQIFDVPPIRVHVTEHRMLARRCRCGHLTRATKPAQLPSRCRTSYGEGITALVSYFSVRQYLPIARLAELITDVLGTPISSGTVAAMLNRSAAALCDTLTGIRERIAHSNVVGSDETPIRENGRRLDAWVWHTDRVAYLARGPGRGSAVHQREFPNGLPQATLVTDRLAAQLATVSKSKQVCIPHLQRTVRGLSEADRATWWCEEMAEVLSQINEAGAYGHRATDEQADQIELAIDKVLSTMYDSEDVPEQEVSLRASLSQVRKALTRCLYDKDVPPDNNGSERLIRNLKVKLKISGQWRSEAGTKAYLAIRSVIETAIKQGLRPLDVLVDPGLLSL